MLIYETKIGILQYFLSSLRCLYVVPISFFTFFQNEKNDSGLILIGVATLILGIVQFSYTLKSFKIYSTFFIVNHPLFLLNRKKKFQKSEIKRIYFQTSSSKFTAGIYLVVKTINSEESYMLTHSKKTINKLIFELKKAEIKTTDFFK